MNNESVDTALILENELHKRVSQVTEMILEDRISKAVNTALREQKEDMMREIAIAIGKMLHVAELEGRKPLWETNPDDTKGIENE